jgi:hypothetical protein
VATLAPTYFEVKRPIQFNYSTFPNIDTQLGYTFPMTAMDDANTFTKTTVSNYGNIIIQTAGTYCLNVSFLLKPHDLMNPTISKFVFGMNSTSETFPERNPTPTKYIQSLITPYLGQLSYSEEYWVSSSITSNFDNGEIVYLNYLLTFDQSIEIFIKGYYTYTRIG